MKIRVASMLVALSIFGSACRESANDMAALTAPVAYALVRNAIKQQRPRGELRTIVRWQSLIRSSAGWPAGEVLFEVESPLYPGKVATVRYVMNGTHLAEAFVKLPGEDAKQVSVNLYESAIVFGQVRTVEEQIADLARKLAGDTSAGDIVAVMDFQGINREETPFGRRISESLVTHLVTAGVPVVERRLLSPLLREIEFQAGGLTLEAGNEARIQLGRFLGANAIVIGTVKHDREELLLNARLIRIESGRVISAAQAIIPAYLVPERDLRLISD